MNDDELLAYMYDFYNDHTLQKQNEDINFYINFIQKNKCKNVLIVGAGTGRVAIPLSSFTRVVALDMDKFRLERLKSKNTNIKIIACNFLDYINSDDEFDLIIFPYSTVQFVSNNHHNMFNQMIKKLFKVVNNDTNILLDFSENFSTKQDVQKKLLFKDYSKELDDFVEVFYSSKKHKNYIRFEVEYHLVNKNHSVYEIEKYNYYDEDYIKRIILNNKFNILSVSNGYGVSNFDSKHIYNIKKDSYER